MNIFKNLKDDIPASIVVFLVAVPLCLGIALASGAPLFAGLISGVIGGVVVGMLSGSALGVSGPAAGLAVIVLNAITDLGSFEVFLVAVMLAGVIQIIMGFAKAGIIAYFFPSSVIHGMLAGIGLIIILKQIPHAFGYDSNPEGEMSFHQMDGTNTFESLLLMFDNISVGVVIISFISLFILLLWETKFIKSYKLTKVLQGPLVVVIIGIVLNNIFKSFPGLSMQKNQLVTIPIPESLSGFLENFARPDFSAFLSSDVYITAIIIAVVASLETLLCVEASDKQDTLKRVTPTNRELKAQGVGNIIAGFVGGLPITQVIVRSSANQQSGGKTKLSTILHGLFLMISIVAIPSILNMIPLGVLAAILLMVGYKLSNIGLYQRLFREGSGQFVPFVITVLGIVFTNLLSGIAMGMFVATFIILRNNFRIPFNLQREQLEGKDNIRIVLSEDVTFLNKATILKTLEQLPSDSHVEIDASLTRFIHFDVFEIIENFISSAKHRNIAVKTINLYENKQKLPIQHLKLAQQKKEST